MDDLVDGWDVVMVDECIEGEIGVDRMVVGGGRNVREMMDGKMVG